jgi:hypothetical protein
MFNIHQAIFNEQKNLRHKAQVFRLTLYTVRCINSGILKFLHSLGWSWARK